MAENRVATIERQVQDLNRRIERLEGRSPVSTPARAPVAPRPPAPPPTPRARPSGAGATASPSLDSLLTARTLAWAGGVVLMLGFVLFFAIAIDRGWIDEQMRVSLGGLFSLGLLATSLLLRERYGRLEAGLVAGGAAIGGLFLTDLAATALYELIPDGMGLVLAAGIAALAIALALAWSTQAVSALGLAGVIVAAPVISADVNTATIGVIAIALCTALALMLAREWRGSMALAVAASAPQALVWIGVNADEHVTATALVAAGFWLIYAGGGIAWALLRRRGGIDVTSALLALSGVAFALFAAFLLTIDELNFTDAQGIGLCVLGAVYVLIAPALLALNRGHAQDEGARDLRTLHWGIGVALIGCSLPILFEHRDLLVALGAGAVVLALAARQLGEERLGLASLAYLGTAALWLLAEASPALLFDDTLRPESGLADVAVVMAAAGAVAALLRERQARLVATWSCGALAVYLGSLAIVALLSSPESPVSGVGLAFGDDPSTSFQRAQTAVSIFWALVGIGALLEGLRRDAPGLRAAGGVLLALAVGKAFLYDLSYLTAFARALSFLGLGSVLLAAAFFYQRLSERLRVQREA